MKNIFKIATIGIILIFLSTGCTKNFVDKDTKKNYTANIMCQPTDKKTIEIYKNNINETNIKIENLPKCTEFKINSGKYENIFNSFFVKPLAYIVLKLGKIVKNYGISIMLVGLFIRLLMIPLTNKSMAQSENMKKASPELKKLEKKYKNKTDKQSMMMKSQEMMLIYKKNKISPISGCLVAFLQLPIFFAFFEAIRRIPAFFEEHLFGLDLGLTPLEGITQENYFYILVVIVIIATTYYSFKNMNMAAMDSSQEKQMQMMYKFMIVFIGVASFTLPIAIALYWVVSSGFTIVQNFIRNKKNKVKEV